MERYTVFIAQKSYYWQYVILSKLTDQFSDITKSQQVFFVEIDKLILTFTWKCNLEQPKQLRKRGRKLEDLH